MASRRDELNAYTSARKRTVGAFLLPSGGGNDEDAPRPVRAVLPSVVIAVVIVAGFAMWGVIKPSAPKGWDSGDSIIQGKESTTRYVILPGEKGKVLHQVLNMSSARLVVKAGAKVVIVADKVLDAYPNHGATIGIPYAPDKLPRPDVAAAEKKWSVCNNPDKDGTKPPSQVVFVAAGADADKLAKPGLMLQPGESMYVQAPPEKDKTPSRYLVDNTGKLHAIGSPSSPDDEKDVIAAALFGSDAVKTPQLVTKEWLSTLETGRSIEFDRVPNFDQNKKVDSRLKISQPAEKRVGRLLFFDKSYFVVGLDQLYAISPFQAALALRDPKLSKLYDNGTQKFAEMSASDYAALKNSINEKDMKDPEGIPDEKPAERAVNFKDRKVLCSTFEGMEGTKVKRSVWADTAYPATVTAGSASARVSPGQGLLFRAMDAASATDSSGSNFLITETGLRYPVPSNSDGGKAGAGAGAGASATPSPEPQPAEQAGQPQVNENAARLGYDKVAPRPVPLQWAMLVPAGPVLTTDSARQAQIA
ncbi:type VII secretion protein EccB [Kitasatospora sp. NPDC002040]|uniref:type VII secretion protein EccB n=1 Tax=Kitasatospora sp. NPDC002040 TaxID=3154661 RepID=UPI003324F435